MILKFKKKTKKNLNTLLKTVTCNRGSVWLCAEGQIPTLSTTPHHNSKT